MSGDNASGIPLQAVSRIRADRQRGCPGENALVARWNPNEQKPFTLLGRKITEWWGAAGYRSRQEWLNESGLRNVTVNRWEKQPGIEPRGRQKDAAVRTLKITNEEFDRAVRESRLEAEKLGGGSKPPRDPDLDAAGVRRLMPQSTPIEISAAWGRFHQDVGQWMPRITRTFVLTFIATAERLFRAGKDQEQVIRQAQNEAKIAMDHADAQSRGIKPVPVFEGASPTTNAPSPPPPPPEDRGASGRRRSTTRR